jgi:hypothetical protein
MRLTWLANSSLVRPFVATSGYANKMDYHKLSILASLIDWEQPTQVWCLTKRFAYMKAKAIISERPVVPGIGVPVDDQVVHSQCLQASSDEQTSI